MDAPKISEEDHARMEFKRAVRRAGRLARDRAGEIKELNITAMMDMMTIILVFLLKSWSASNASIEMNPQLTPPTSSTQLHPDDSLTITVSEKAILVGDKPVALLESAETAPGCPSALCAIGAKVPANMKEGNSDDSFLIAPLFDKLNKEVERMEYIAKYNAKAPFTGRVTIVADRYIPYRLLTEVLYTAGKAKLDLYRFLVLTKETPG
jgi:biopolymer transport protein ExbD